jgi:hypothetical protein
MKFEIEKDTGPQGGNFPHGCGSRCREKLAADLEQSDKISHVLREFPCGAERIKVEGDDQATAWMGVEAQGRGDPDFVGVSVPQVVVSVRAGPGSRPSGSGQSSGRRDRIHQFRVLLDRDRGH